MASIFDEIGAAPPANAPIGSAQWQDWASRQNYLKQLRAQLPAGTPLDLPEPVLQAIANGGQPEQGVGTWDQNLWAQNPYEKVIPPDPQARSDMQTWENWLGYQQVVHGDTPLPYAYNDTTGTWSMAPAQRRHGGAVDGALTRMRRSPRRRRFGALSAHLR